MKRAVHFEPDPEAARLASTILERNGFTVTTVSSETEALMCVHGDRPDLILVSVEYGRTAGFHLCNRIKRDAVVQAIPLIVMATADLAESCAQHQKLRTRADGYLLRPFD